MITPSDNTPVQRTPDGFIVLNAQSQLLFDALQRLPEVDRNAIIQNSILLRGKKKAEEWQRAIELAEQRRAANPKHEPVKTYSKRPGYKS